MIGNFANSGATATLNINNSTTSYAGGAGGGRRHPGAGSMRTGPAGAANTGNAGGASSECKDNCFGGAGGSGVVIVRYAAANSTGNTGGTITSYTSGPTTYQVHSFTGSDPAGPVTANGDVTHSRAETGKVGNSSIYFDGYEDYLTIPTNTVWDMGTGSFTIECWARFDAVGDIDTIIERDFGSNARAFYIAKQANNTIIASTGSGSGWISSITSSSTVAADTWYHIA